MSRYTVEGEGFMSVNEGGEWSCDPGAPPVDTGAIWRAAGAADLRQRIVEALRERAKWIRVNHVRSVLNIAREVELEMAAADLESGGWPEKEGTK